MLFWRPAKAAFSEMADLFETRIGLLDLEPSLNHMAAAFQVREMHSLACCALLYEIYFCYR